MFELFGPKKGNNGPLKKLSEKEIQDILYGHLDIDAQAEAKKFELEQRLRGPAQPPPKITPVKPEPAKQTIKQDIPEEPRQKAESRLKSVYIEQTKTTIQGKTKAQTKSAEAEPKVESTIQLPKFKLPKITMPRIEIPKIKLPKFSIPKIDFPKFNFPKLELSPFLVRIKASLPFVTIAIVVLIIIMRLSTVALQAKPSRVSVDSLKNNTTARKSVEDLTKPYTIQAAVYSKQDDAEKVAASLGGRGYPAYYIKTVSSRGLVRYRLYIGNYENKDEASDILKKLVENENFTDSFVRIR